MDIYYPLYPVFAFLSFILCLIPLPWHWQAWNAGTCAFMIWTATVCLVEFINALIWQGNVDNVAPVWCDITAQIILGYGIGVNASALCISRRLYKITCIRTVSVTREDKRRGIIEDLCVAVGIPILALILHIVVHPHRFDILENIGCYPVTYNTLPAYFLWFMWPLLLAVASFIYAALTLRSFFRRRAEFATLISSQSNSSMNTSRYLRLMILALVNMLFALPLGIYVIYIGSKGVRLAPWVSWADTHYGFSRVDQIPALIWRGDYGYEVAVELTRWLSVFCAFLFFALFGFASEAKKQYRLAFWKVSGWFGFKPAPSRAKVMAEGSTNTDEEASPAFAHVQKRPESIDVAIALGTYKEENLSPSSPSSTAPPSYRLSSARSFPKDEKYPLPPTPRPPTPTSLPDIDSTYGHSTYNAVTADEEDEDLIVVSNAYRHSNFSDDFHPRPASQPIPTYLARNLYPPAPNSRFSNPVI
ncbi:putative pheromone receptor [Desarmillaria tabescens]|uniref:Pheromone receptor n=1 Tax=Armillaria tabescens TaxID=1929756 RepID=A0AA39J4Z0_ARMTA|nr:putative pheromone receptor [Desarmillaria tabescens]KAK0435341.1 putative pheromone receptor [Desarmillaria tabescens]